MTDSVDESNAKGDHSMVEIREEGERCEREVRLVDEQTLSRNEENKDELLASLIGTKLPHLSPEADHTCIFRVPNKLVRDNENAFVPQVVSIGPYHQGGKKLQAMERMKLWNLECLLDHKPTPETSLVKLVKEIRSREEFLRNCYEQKFDNLSSDQFVEMMVVDGCFIIQLICKDIQTGNYEHLLRLSPQYRDMLSPVEKDLLLLENQLSWQVLDRLFNLTRTSEERDLYQHISDFRSHVTWDLFRHRMPIDKPTETRQIRHLLDNVRDLLVGSSPWIKMQFDNWVPIPSATHLEEIGVKFQPVYWQNLLNITFNRENGVMEIPHKRIRSNTESVFRNLIAYE